MDPTSLLAQLRDVHRPEAIGAWPPAIGWILLVLLAGITLITFVWFTFRWYRSNAWRRAALKEYKLLQKNYQQTPSVQALTEISSLLKRCAASINKDTTMLAKTGTAWKKLLHLPNSPLNEHEIKVLCFGHYQTTCGQLDNNALLRIKKWIKTLKPYEYKSYSNDAVPNEIDNTSLQDIDLKKNATVALPNLDDKIENKTS